MSKDLLIKQLTLALSEADYTLASYLNEQIKLIEETTNDN